MRPKILTLALTALLVCSSCSLAALTAIRARSVTDRPIEIEQDLRPAPRSAVAEIVEQVLSSVVNVKVREAVDRFGNETSGEGSGVIIDEAGVVLTNAHVVEGAITVEVAFSDGRSPVTGQVVGAIAERDLAIVRIDAPDLSPITVGSSEGLRLGDEVIAIGYPLGLGGPTVTRGIISGRARSIESDTPGGEHVALEGLLQTDAAINPGNSGGALIDRAGRLVGINTAVAGFAENIGFAIAIDDALPTVEEILNETPEQNAWLGVQTGPLEPATATELELPADAVGVVVVNVFDGTPAAEAGIEEGDVIVSVDGRPVASPSTLTRLVTDRDPGDSVTVDIVNEDGRRSVEVVLAERPVTLDVDR